MLSNRESSPPKGNEKKEKKAAKEGHFQQHQRGELSGDYGREGTVLPKGGGGPGERKKKKTEPEKKETGRFYDNEGCRKETEGGGGKGGEKAPVNDSPWGGENTGSEGRGTRQDD